MEESLQAGKMSGEEQKTYKGTIFDNNAFPKRIQPNNEQYIKSRQIWFKYTHGEISLDQLLKELSTM